MHTIKIKRALRLSTIGSCHYSAMAMLDAIPETVVAALTSAQIAELIDANWRLAQASKAIAEREIVAEGAVWDARTERMIELRAH